MNAVRASYHAGLTRAAVVEAAVGLLDVRGAGGFSVRQLATELGVDTMALYKHVRNKDDLLGAAVARVFADARLAGDGQWWEQVTETFREQRRVMRERPWVLNVLMSFTLESAEPWEGVDRTLALLQRHLGAGGAARWVRLLAAFTNGFVLSEPDTVDVPDTQQVASRYPRVAAAAGRNERTGQRDFDLGLGLLVAGMRAEAEGRLNARSVRS